MFDSIKNFCDSFLDLGVPGFDLCVFKDGKSILRYMNGFSDLANKVKMQGNEKYNIYSCTKIITCTAALQLWEKGLFSLEDKLSDYMSEFKEMTVKTKNGIKKAEKPILIKHLFEMTAGFSYDVESPQILKCKLETGGKCPTRDTMKYLAKEPLLFEPGERWEYSFCHDVLAALVETISGEKFESYVKKNIFDVLEMSNSTLMLSEKEIESVSPQYRFINGVSTSIDKHIQQYKFGSDYASGGAGGISTVEDFIKFLEGLRTGVLLNSKTLEMMKTDRLTKHQKNTYLLKETYGYGLGVRCPIESKIHTDFGWGGAAGAYFAVDANSAISIFLGMHLLSSPAQGIRSMLFRLVKASIEQSEEIRSIQKDLKTLYHYNLTY